MHCSAAGKSVLAALPEDEVRSVIARTGLPRRTSHTITNLDQLLRHLNSVRRNGFALDDEENEARVRCVGAVVLHESGVPAAGVSVSSLDIDLRDTGMRRNAALVVAAAHAISGALGAQSLDGGT
jgi:IclR family acetate operon transcriptional repressor